MLDGKCRLNFNRGCLRSTRNDSFDLTSSAVLCVCILFYKERGY